MEQTTLEDGSVVTVNEDSVEIPQIPQVLNKELLLNRQKMAQIQFDVAKKELDKANELLGLIT